MQTKQLHIRLGVDELNELNETSEKCGLNPTSLGAVLLKAAMRAIKLNNGRVPLPLEFEIKGSSAEPPKANDRGRK